MQFLCVFAAWHRDGVPMKIPVGANGWLYPWPEGHWHSGFSYDN